MSKKLLVYDNEGRTFDRYTVIFPNGDVYGMSENSTSPQGFNQFLGNMNEEIHLGNRGIKLDYIPDCVILGLKARGYTSLEL